MNAYIPVKNLSCVRRDPVIYKQLILVMLLLLLWLLLVGMGITITKTRPNCRRIRRSLKRIPIKSFFCF